VTKEEKARQAIDIFVTFENYKMCSPEHGTWSLEHGEWRMEHGNWQIGYGGAKART